MIKIGNFTINTQHIAFIEENADDLELGKGIRICFVNCSDDVFLVGEDEELFAMYLREALVQTNIYKYYSRGVKVNA